RLVACTERSPPELCFKPELAAALAAAGNNCPAAGELHGIEQKAARGKREQSWIAAHQPADIALPEQDTPLCGDFSHLLHGWIQHARQLASAQRHHLQACLDAGEKG